MKAGDQPRARKAFATVLYEIAQRHHPGMQWDSMLAWIANAGDRARAGFPSFNHDRARFLKLLNLDKQKERAERARAEVLAAELSRLQSGIPSSGP
jgi:hypothetical protein